jgi:hypothetical protein
VPDPRIAYDIVPGRHGGNCDVHDHRLAKRVRIGMEEGVSDLPADIVANKGYVHKAGPDIHWSPCMAVVRPWLTMASQPCRRWWDFTPHGSTTIRQRCRAIVPARRALLPGAGAVGLQQPLVKGIVHQLGAVV